MDYQTFKIPGLWGGWDHTSWFRTVTELPEIKSNESLILHLDLGKGDPCNLGGAESLLYINGKPRQGIDKCHSTYRFEKELLNHQTVEIGIKGFNGLQKEKNIFSTASLKIINNTVNELYLNLKVSFEALLTFDHNEVVYTQLCNLLNEVINLIDFRVPDSVAFLKTVDKATKFLKSELSKLKAKFPNDFTIYASGHSHIDVAWLWQLKHTREKCARTFSTVLKLMEEYPDYRFLQSTPQLYEFIKEDYPDIYIKIKERIKEGRWEATGGMWVEADCNVPSGESLVRQFLYGIKFFREEFDISCKTLWLPDVFGYSWALPQIIKQCGMSYFMTTKISWNQFNRPEYDTFKWRGIDGTEVLTHFITAPESLNNNHYYTYHADLNPECVMGTWENYRQKDVNKNLLVAYGWGDGGGGPTYEMLENANRMKSIPGLPEIRMANGEAFFEELDKVTRDKKLPVVDGELYLEYHRGTYTSQGKTKKNNRKTEILLHDLEYFASLCKLSDTDYVYPKKEIDAFWKTLLKNQFHDILPGSSIKEVYQDSEAEFDALRKMALPLIEEAKKTLIGKMDIKGETLIIFNTLPWARDGEIFCDASELKGKNVENSDTVTVVNYEDGSCLIKVRDIPGFGIRQLNLVEHSSNIPVMNQVSVSKTHLENHLLRVELNESGHICSIYDKIYQREYLEKDTQANVLKIFEDRPLKYDAWDIDIYYSEKEYSSDIMDSVEVVEQNRIRGVLKIRKRLFEGTTYQSSIEQDIILHSDSRRIDFKTTVDWHAHQILLKTEFPVNVRSTKATYDIQFGNVERPTHWNTRWDYAKFEMLGHKWADLSERDYGVALLNDCKYGYDIKDNKMRLTLIKSGIMPDKTADQGRHEFTYSLLPHDGDWFNGNVHREACELNYDINHSFPKPSETESGIQLNSEFHPFTFNSLRKSSMIDTLKVSEDGKGYILRIFEYGNCTDDIKITCDRKIKEAYLCNLLEEKIDSETLEVDQKTHCLKTSVKPFEIKTIKIIFNLV